MKKRIKANGMIIFLAVLLLFLFPRAFMRINAGGVLEEAAKISGSALILLGQLLRVSGRGYKAENSQSGRVLLQGGPYSLTRNPMYLGILLIGIGVVLVLFKWWVAVVFVAIFIARYLLLIYREEKKLAAVFPAEYPSYCKNVPRLLPALNTLLKKDVSEYLPIKLSWVKKEIGSIVAVLLATLFLSSWMEIKYAGLSAFPKKSIYLLSAIIFFAGLTIYLNGKSNKCSG